MVVKNTIVVSVRGLADVVVADRVRRSAGDALSHLVGTWHVAVDSPEPGCWHLRLTGDFGVHVAHFLAHPDGLPEALHRALLAFLRDVVPPLSERPAPVVIARIDANRTWTRYETVPRGSRPAAPAA
jgi:hypothetical protein